MVDPPVAELGQSLAGVRVLVTRPRDQAGPLVAAIEARGGVAFVFPAIEIAPVREAAPALGVLQRLDRYDVAVFVSVNAVNGAAALQREGARWPEHLDIVAQGDATRRALCDRGLGSRIRATGRFGSEALLEVPPLARAEVSGKRVALFKGVGGRERLANELQRRGAKVDFAEVYRRERPAADPREVLRRGRDGEFNHIVVTSGEAARNLFAMLAKPQGDWLCESSYVAISARVARVLRECGARRAVLVAPQANDAGLVEALERRRAPAGPGAARR